MILMMMNLEDDKSKLDTTLNNLAHLKRLLNKSNNNCSKMVDVLTNFDDRLLKLEETVQPVYKETGNLQRQQEAIVSTLSRLDFVVKYYTVAGEVEPNIINGPGSSSMYPEYIRDLSRLTEAVEYFERNNVGSPEMMNCSSLLAKGGEIIEKEFRDNLTRHMKEEIQVDVIMDLIRSNNHHNDKNIPEAVEPSLQKQTDSDRNNNNNENNKDEKAKPLTESKDNESKSVQQSDQPTSVLHIHQLLKFPDRAGSLEKIIQDLKLLAEWLCSNRTEEFIKTYARLRSLVLMRSLNRLRDHLKSSTFGSIINSVGDSLSPLLGGRKNLHLMKTVDLSSMMTNEKSTKKGSKLINRIQAVSMDMISAGSGTAKSPMAVTSQANTSTDGAGNQDLVSVNERDIFFYVLTMTGLYKLMQLELKLIESIVVDQQQKIIFSRLILEALNSVHKEGDSLSSRVKRSMQQNKDFNPALYLLPVLRYHAHMRHSFDLLLDGCLPDVSNRLYSLGVILQTTISKTLEEFIEYIKTDTIHARVPKDGTVHEMTSNVMLFLVHLLSYLDILSRVVTVTDYQALESFADKNKIAFAQYISRVLSALGLALRKKSESYGHDSALKALFCLNNTYYILKTLKTSSLLSIVDIYRLDIEDDYEHQIREFKIEYSTSWSKLLYYIMENNNMPSLSQQRGSIVLPYGHSMYGGGSGGHSTMPTSMSAYTLSSMGGSGNKLKDKDRQAIKDKFAGFNKEFDSLLNIQRSYAIPDSDLRSELKREHVNHIVPKYRFFYEKYSQMEFTKNLHKYVKYTPEHVAQSISMFFDSLA